MHEFNSGLCDVGLNNVVHLEFGLGNGMDDLVIVSRLNVLAIKIHECM